MEKGLRCSNGPFKVLNPIHAVTTIREFRNPMKQSNNMKKRGPKFLPTEVRGLIKSHCGGCSAKGRAVHLFI